MPPERSAWEPVDESGLYYNAEEDDYQVVPPAEVLQLDQLGARELTTSSSFSSKDLARPVVLELLDKLARGRPTSEIRQLVPPEARREWNGFWDWFVHNAGFTEEEDYAGLYPAAALAWYYLGPPLETLWTIEKQVVGVLEQLHSFLGGTGSAIARGEQTLGGVLKTLGTEAEKWLGSVGISASPPPPPPPSSTPPPSGNSSNGSGSSGSGSSPPPPSGDGSVPAGGYTSDPLKCPLGTIPVYQFWGEHAGTWQCTVGQFF
jgi:hypothetical protein